jgi:hypothetical protein
MSDMFFVKHSRKHFVFFSDHKTPHPYGATTYLNKREGTINIFSFKETWRVLN